MLQQYTLTPAAGKRLIAKGLAAEPTIQAVLKQGRLVIVAGSTNGYVAEEILKATGQLEGFSRKGFRRGMVTPPGFDPALVAADFPGDVVLVDGVWQRGLQIFDVVGDLAEGDLVLKGGNAVNLEDRQAGVLIGHPEAGTVGAVVPLVPGRRVRLIVPIGLEKRVIDPIADLAALLNEPGAEGPRMMPVPGDIYTELEALSALTGAWAALLAGGGIYGAEGSVWLGVTGTAEQLAAAAELLGQVAAEPPCEV